MDQVVPYVATPRTNYLDFLLIWHSRVLRKNSISKIHEITAVQKKKLDGKEFNLQTTGHKHLSKSGKL